MWKKTNVDFQGMDCQHCAKTVTDSLTGREGVKSAMVNLQKNEAVVKYGSSLETEEEKKNLIIKSGSNAMEISKTESLSSLTALIATIILFVGIIGCSDVPYTGPILSVDHVDRYLESTGHDTVCLQDGFDSICLKIVDLEEDNDPFEPVIFEIYPQSINFVFYYDSKPILEASMAMDTTELIQELIDSGRVDMPPGSTVRPSGSLADKTDSWKIQIYYPDSFPETERGLYPETSGFDIKVADGSNLNIKKNDELELMYFIQRDKEDGSRVAEFHVLTESKAITIQVDGLVSDNTVIFYIDTDGVESGEGTNKLLFGT